MSRRSTVPDERVLARLRSALDEVAAAAITGAGTESGADALAEPGTDAVTVVPVAGIDRVGDPIVRPVTGSASEPVRPIGEPQVRPDVVPAPAALRTSAPRATALRTPADRGGRDPRARTATLVGVAAACAALIGGAAWALSQRAPSPTDVAAPDASQAAPVTTAVGADEPWFALAAANLVPGPVERSETAYDGDGSLFMSWEVVNGDERGFVVAEIAVGVAGDGPPAGRVAEERLPPPEDGRWWTLAPADTAGADAPTDDTGHEVYWVRDDGSLWWFRSQGLSRTILEKTLYDAVPGSGVPIVLDDPTATVVSVGVAPTVAISQASAGTAGGTVELTVNNGATAPAVLVAAIEVVPVTIAGQAGWMATYADGHVEVVWAVGGGWWGHLAIGAELAPQATGIVASVTPALP